MMRKMGFVILCSFSLLAYGQKSTNSYNLEFFGSASTGEHTPFWTVNHRWGTTALESNSFYLRAGFFHQQLFAEDWSFDFGVDLVGSNHSNYGNPWLQQLYGRLQWKALRLDVGSREDYSSLLNPRLSSGDLAGSNHARPLPQIGLSLSDFLPVPGTKRRIFVRGEFHVGAYLDGNYVESQAFPTVHNYARDLLSHSKSLYFRLWDMEAGDRRQFTLGFLHRAQWGGTLMQEDYWNPGSYIEARQPQDFDSFLRMLLAREGSSQASYSDRLFVSGSHWGAYLLKYDYRLPNNSYLHAYIEHFFEDGTGMILQNYPDNLYGLEWRSRRPTLVSGVVVEYLYMKQQTGPIHFGDLGGERGLAGVVRGGNDNYYNNVDYVQGPSHFGKSQGTPLFLSPEYNEDGTVNFHGSRVQALHLGVEGYLHPRLQYVVLLTAGRNWGRYYQPFTYVHKGFASQVEFTYTFAGDRGWQARFATGYDEGDFFGGRTLGASVTLIKQGLASCLCQ